MDYLKFNCYDMAEIADELRRIAIRSENLLEEYRGVSASLEPQLKGCEGLARAMPAAAERIAECCGELRRLHRNLDSIADLYYSAEKKAENLNEALPVSISAHHHGRATANLPKVPAAVTSNGDMLLENWLAALVHQSGGESENPVLR